MELCNFLLASLEREGSGLTLPDGTLILIRADIGRFCWTVFCLLSCIYSSSSAQPDEVRTKSIANARVRERTFKG